MVILTLASCNDDYPYYDYPSWGTVHATWNDLPWDAHAYVINDDPRDTTFTIILHHLFREGGFLIQEQLVTYKVPKHKGVFPITSSINIDDRISAGLYITEGIDVFVANYSYLPTMPNSFMEIEGYQRSTGLIKGNFNIVLENDAQVNHSGYADTVRIKGEFFTRTLPWD